MGLVYISAIVSSGNIEKEDKFLVDSGATYTLLKKDIWQSLGLSPKRQIELILADGTKIIRNISECFIKLIYENVEGHTPVILGEEGDDENLIGVVTLEILGLILDPFKRELRPIKVILY